MQDESPSTVPLIPLVLMPSLYTGTVFLCAAYRSAYPPSLSTRLGPRPATWTSGSSPRTGDLKHGMKVNAKEKGKRDDTAYAEATALHLRATGGRRNFEAEGSYSTASDAHASRSNASSNRPGNNMVVNGGGTNQPGAASPTNTRSASRTRGPADATAANAGSNDDDNRASILSGPSEAAVSLELPVFRPGRARAWHAYAPYGPYPIGDDHSLWNDDDWDEEPGYGNGDGSDDDEVSESEIGSVWGDEVFRLGYDDGEGGGKNVKAYGEEGRQAGMWGYGFAGGMSPSAIDGEAQAGSSSSADNNRGTGVYVGPTNVAASGSGAHANASSSAGPWGRGARRGHLLGPRQQPARAYAGINAYATMPRYTGVSYITNANEDEVTYADEDDDRVSMLSGTSAPGNGGRSRSRSRSIGTSTRRVRHRANAARALMTRRRTMPASPRNGSAASSVNELPLSRPSPGFHRINPSAPGSPAESVLVIGRQRNGSGVGHYDYSRRGSEGYAISGGNAGYGGYGGYYTSGAPTREPSIAAGASVAATRASTGSAWSGWSAHVYPRPLILPELDADLGAFELDQETGEVREVDPKPCSGSGEGNEEGSGTNNGSGEGTNVGSGGTETNLTTSAGTGSSGTGTYQTAYSPTMGLGEENDSELPDSVLGEGEPRRRWRVHPLKRMVEMGRLKR